MSEKEVLFVSQRPFGQCENLMAVYDAYDHPKVFRQGQKSMENAELEGFAAVVCDALPLAMVKYKNHCKSINIGHGIAGVKLYGMDEKFKPWLNIGALAQLDYVIAPSSGTKQILAQQHNVPIHKVLALGFPRTDWFVNNPVKKDPVAVSKLYVYTPTFRYEKDGYLPKIRWKIIDDLLEEDERLYVKRHYFTKEPLLKGRKFKRILEADPNSSGDSLLYMADVLVTDYSSIMFDAYLMGKPVVLFTDDADIFLEERGMYLPFPEMYSSRHIHAEGNEEGIVEMLREAYSNGLTQRELDTLKLVADKCDGKSTERVIKLIESCI